MREPEPLSEEAATQSIEDEKFDQIYSARIRKLSSVHWTPFAVAAEAGAMLITVPGTRVLDVGCGPGKFCLVAAGLTDGHFTGVELREDLARAGREATKQLQLGNVEIRQGNVLEMKFSDYDAFYLYNPFEENMARGHKIDGAIPLSPLLFKRYNRHVAHQLGLKPLGTRVVTYAGYADEIPSCYECERTLFGDELKLWTKRHEYDPVIERLGLHVSRSYRGPIGWVEPQSPI